MGGARLRVKVCLLPLLALAACASIPLSTLGHLSQLSDEDLATLAPQDLRVRVTLMPDCTLDVPDTRVTFAWTPSRGERREATFDMIAETAGRRTVSGRVGRSVDGNSYVLKLTPASAATLREFQRFISPGTRGDANLDVMVALASVPPGTAATTVWVDILLSPERGYWTLIDGGTLRLDRPTVYGGSRS